MDQSEFTALYGETAVSLRGYIRRVSGDAGAADDLLQETYLRFLRAQPQIAERAAMKAYLYKIATAIIYDRWRRSRRERLWRLALGPRQEAAPAAASGDVARCFEKLKPRERALLWLAYVEGCSHPEIAASLGLSQNSIKVLLFRARRNLENVFRQNGIAGESET